MFYFSHSYSRPNGSDLDYKQAKAGTAYEVGDALVLTGGVLEKATGTTVPTHISAAKYAAPGTGAKRIAVLPVLPGQMYLTTFAADATAVTEGSKVTIHTDAAQVTATAAGGVATVQKKYGDGSIGSDVLVSF